MYVKMDGNKWPQESQAKDGRSLLETSDDKESRTSSDSFSDILRDHFRRRELPMLDDDVARSQLHVLVDHRQRCVA